MLKLNEELFDNLTIEEKNNGISTMIHSSISNLHSVIDDYNSVVATLNAEGREDLIPIFEDIIEEENKNLGKLETALNQINPIEEIIDTGKQEAEDLIYNKDNQPIEESLNESKALNEEFNDGDERILKPEEEAYKNMEELVNMLNMSNVVSTKDEPVEFYIKDVYLDYGANWMWTTIICKIDNEEDETFSSYQLLSPKQWLDIVNGEDLNEVLNNIIDGEYSGLKRVEVEESLNEDLIDDNKQDIERTLEELWDNLNEADSNASSLEYYLEKAGYKYPRLGVRSELEDAMDYLRLDEPDILEFINGQDEEEEEL